MTTKTFNDICVEYAHQLGKGLPLTAPEMCNAVIMYLNAQITEMQGITTALQTAVTEAESSATEAINRADDVSEKVDTLQTTVTEAESNATEALNKANDVSETVNALPKVPTPTTSDNGKVIGVQSGEYALVEQSGGEAPANMMTTDTNQTIDGIKTFNKLSLFHGTVKLLLPAGSPDCCIVVSKENSLNTLCITESVLACRDNSGNWYRLYYPSFTASHDVILPHKDGTIATLTDIPDLDNYTGIVHIVQGIAGSGVAVHGTAKTSPYTKYGYDKIVTYGNSNTLQYTLKIPNKNGTIATLDDIGSSSEIYYTSFFSTSPDSVIAFACITTTNLGGEIAYSELNSTISGLGYNDENNVLPASGIINSKNVYGIWSDGSTIHCLCTDFTQEDLPDDATINAKSV